MSSFASILTEDFVENVRFIPADADAEALSKEFNGNLLNTYVEPVAYLLKILNLYLSTSISKIMGRGKQIIESQI